MDNLRTDSSGEHQLFAVAWRPPRLASIPDLGARPSSQTCPRPAVKFALTNATFAFDDVSRPRYDKIWRTSVLRVVVSFRFRIAILCLNAHVIWYLAAAR